MLFIVNVINTANANKFNCLHYLDRVIVLDNFDIIKIQLHSSPLDTEGPFDMVNPLRKLLPQGVHTISLSFTPQASQKVGIVCHIISLSFTPLASQKVSIFYHTISLSFTPQASQKVGIVCHIISLSFTPQASQKVGIWYLCLSDLCKCLILSSLFIKFRKSSMNQF